MLFFLSCCRSPKDRTDMHRNVILVLVMEPEEDRSWPLAARNTKLPLRAVTCSSKLLSSSGMENLRTGEETSAYSNEVTS